MHEHGGPEAMRLEEITLPSPGPREAQVRIEAAGVNFIDVYLRTGLYPSALPFGLGLEGEGTVLAVGEEVSHVEVGDRVAWARAPGSYAEAVNANADALVRLPEGLEVGSGAAAMLQGMTAHYLTHGVRDTQPGDVALVHAAAGGTGQLLVQLLKRAGARVLGTCSTEEKAERVLAAGAERAILYTREDFVEACKQATDGRGVDVVYDSVGAETFDRSLTCLRRRGLMALFGQASGPVPPFELQRLNQLGSLFITRPTLFDYVATREALEERASDVLGAVRDGSLSLMIGARFPLEKAADAHRALEGRGTMGKLLLMTA
jgi:NADPH2:quinone reductase